jgi:hypothetical protein
MSKKKIILFSLIFALVASFGGNIATPMADTIKEQKAQKKKLERKRAKEAEKIEKLKAQKSEIEDAIKRLDEKKQTIELNISDYNVKIDKMEKTIAKVEIEIKAAEKVENEQYDIMKKRIRYMYENGESDYFDIILGSKSVEDLLNQGEYMAKISDYDNTLLDRYKEAKRIAKEKKVEKEEKLAELNMTLAELEIKKAENERLAQAKGVQMEKFAALIKEAGNKISEYDLEIGKKEQYIDQLIAAAEKAERERREREAREAAARLANQANQTGQIVTGKASAAGMIWPMPSSSRITSGFGYRSEVMYGSGTFHNGIDIAVNAGTPIIAAKAGRVIGAGYHYSMGNHVIIDHGGGVYTVYMHASRLLVSVGQEVSRGQTIALVGSTGMSTGPHLHFSVKINGAYVNPLKYVSP